MSDLPELSGPSLPPATGQAAEHVVILVHGVGADGNDLIGLAPLFQAALPGAFFVAPNAPQRYDQAPTGYQWFPIGDFAKESRLSGARTAAPILDAFIDRTLAEHRLDESRLALVGFSQGTMMSLFVGLRRARPLAGIVGYSGMLVGEELLADEMRSRPPVLLVHGEADPLLPVSALGHAVSGLEAHGVAVEHHARPGLGHGIDEAGVRLGVRFLCQVLTPAEA